MAVELAQIAREASVIERALKPSAKPRNRNMFGEWFAQWRKPIRSWLRNRAPFSPGDIDDMTQEVFVKLLRYSEDTAVDNPQGYLFRIAANVANEWSERSRVRYMHDADWLEELIAEDDVESEIDRGQFRAEVMAAANKLPHRQRQVLMLHIAEDLKYWQVAERLRITERMVLRDLTRAYAILRMALANNDAILAAGINTRRVHHNTRRRESMKTLKASR